jgi:hypothetical protein
LCYDFHFGISNGEEDIMFAIELDLFSIRIIVVPGTTQTKPISKLDHTIDNGIVEHVPKHLLNRYVSYLLI